MITKINKNITKDEHDLINSLIEHNDYKGWMSNWIYIEYSNKNLNYVIYVYEPDNHLLYEGTNIDEAIQSFSKSTFGNDDETHMNEVRFKRGIL